MGAGFLVLTIQRKNDGKHEDSDENGNEIVKKVGDGKRFIEDGDKFSTFGFMEILVLEKEMGSSFTTYILHSSWI